MLYVHPLGSSISGSTQTKSNAFLEYLNPHVSPNSAAAAPCVAVSLCLQAYATFEKHEEAKSLLDVVQLDERLDAISQTLTEPLGCGEPAHKGDATITASVFLGYTTQGLSWHLLYKAPELHPKSKFG